MFQKTLPHQNFIYLKTLKNQKNCFTIFINFDQFENWNQTINDNGHYMVIKRSYLDSYYALSKL